MIKTELTPLVNTDSKNNKTKCRIIPLSILVLCVIAFLVYSSANSDGESENNLFLNENPRKSIPEWYPTQEELDEYRSTTVFIEYDMEDAPETYDLGSDIMQQFHDKLIKEHAYNSKDYNIKFVVSDVIDTTTSLSCKTMYGIADEPGFMGLHCGDYFETARDNLKITGCVSYEADTDGVRKGERAIEDGVVNSIDCAMDVVGEGLTILSGRCCRASRRIGFQVQYGIDYSEVSDDYCSDIYCTSNEYDTAIGCTASVINATDTFSGVKRTEDDRTGATGCTAQRSTPGDLYIQPYCAKVAHGALRCRTSYDKIPTELLKANKWISRARCEEDMTLMDCDSQIKAEINQCNEGLVEREGDKGTNYGAFISRKTCVALGDTDHIVAVATCCTVDNLN